MSDAGAPSGSHSRPPPTAAIDTANHAIVARSQAGIFMFNPPHPGAPMTDERALSLAAWLVAMVDPSELNPDDRFAAVLRAIRNT